MAQDRAETGRLQELLARVGGGLDEFLKFEHADAMSRQQAWRAALEQPLPQQGVGIDAVVRELLEQVIPNGSQVSKPGFTAFITTGGTSVSTLASTAASIVRHNDMARALADSCRQHDNLELLLEPMLSV
jgi:aromatic-L-amino-acid decarboxylase